MDVLHTSGKMRAACRISVLIGLLLGLLAVPGEAQPTDEIDFEESIETAVAESIREMDLTDARMLAPFDLYWGVP